MRRNQVNELNEEGKHIKGFIDLELSSHHLTVIKQLQKRVNVIPIIAKADEFTIAQTESVKTLLHALCSNSTFMNPMGFAQGSPAENESYDSIGRLAMADGVDSGNEVVENTPLTPIIRSRSNSMHRVPLKRNRKRFSQVAIKPSEAEISKIFPISLISPEKFDLPPMPKGVSMQDNLIDQPSRFQRKFKYGIADVLNENHCDFIGFKKVLFGTGWKTLKELTEEKFEEFRTERLQERQARSRSNTSSAVPS